MDLRRTGPLRYHFLCQRTSKSAEIPRHPLTYHFHSVPLRTTYSKSPQRHSARLRYIPEDFGAYRWISAHADGLRRVLVPSAAVSSGVLRNAAERNAPRHFEVGLRALKFIPHFNCNSIKMSAGFPYSLSNSFAFSRHYLF